MKKVIGISALALLVIIPSIGWPADDLDLTSRFLLLATKKTSTMQKELDQAAAAGYRLLMGARTSGTEMMVILEKVAEPPSVYQYQLLATTRTSTLQREIDEAAASGFRLVQRTMAFKTHPFGSDETIVIMEKAPGTPKHYTYQLLATSRTGTLQNEIEQAVTQGFALVALSGGGEHMAIMEREAETPSEM